MRWMLLGIPALLGAWSLLPRIDHIRHERLLDTTLLYPPDGEQLRIISTGQEEPMADLLWVRTVLVFGERYSVETGTRWTSWLEQMILATTTLDPTWRTPYFYGGVMLRVVEDIHASDMVFSKATRNLPEDWFFPFSLGMNAYLYRNDRVEAATWLKKAAVLPGAPSWYAAAAAAMDAEAGGRRAAMVYLQGVLQSTSDPGIREATQIQLARMQHDEIVEQWAEACRRYRVEHDRRLERPEDLEKLGFKLPENPRGDKWIVGRDGVVRSEGAEQDHWREALKGGWKLVGR